jgi:site-specific DNA-cytosine methylase
VNVLSLFDGLSGAQIALGRANIEIDNYYASEIDKYSMAVAQYHYPKTIQLGGVEKVNIFKHHNINLLIGGSPCNDLSGAKINGRGLKGIKSKLFYEYVRLKDQIDPDNFLLENVGSMKNVDRDIITKIMGVSPIVINSKLVSALERKRYYWTNIPTEIPKDKEIYLDSIISTVVDDKYFFTEKTELSMQKILIRSKERGFGFRSGIIDESEFKHTKFKNLDANYHKGCDGKRSMLQINNKRRMATPKEAEMLQTVPCNFTLIPWLKRMMSDTRRYMMLGNGFTIDVIAHILKGIK